MGSQQLGVDAGQIGGPRARAIRRLWLTPRARGIRLLARSVGGARGGIRARRHQGDSERRLECEASAFTWIEIGDNPALAVGIGEDGVLVRNVIQDGEMVEDGEIVEGSAEAVAEWVVGRTRLLHS